jgi:hypothetical protein
MSSKQTFEITFRPWAKSMDRYGYDGITGATPAEAVAEHAMAVLGMDEGAASDRVGNAEFVIVDHEYGAVIEGHVVDYRG